LYKYWASEAFAERTTLNSTAEGSFMKSTFPYPPLAIGLFFMATTAVAHHGPGSFDRQREVTLEGEVTRFLWAAPHVYIDLSVTNETDQNTTWSIEASPPQALAKLGWSPRSLTTGDHVTVIAFPPRDPRRTAAAARSVLKADGTLLTLPQSPAGFAPTLRTPFEAPDLSGQWLPRYDMALVTQAIQPGVSWALTEKGRAAVEEFDPNVDLEAQACISESVPFVMMFPNMLSIELRDDVVLIRQEGEVDRTVYMNLDSHDGVQPGHQGHSIGSWEDGVLSVDTTHFTDHRSGNAFGLPSGSQKHLVERFALTPDKTGLEYTFRLDDPEYLAEPVTGTVVLTHRPDLPFVNLPCDPESARRYLEE
jgi:hypothetical protein